ncbi:MAG: hypothetical protein ACREF4_12945, partial [Gammaproteobacteria bacterium]
MTRPAGLGVLARLRAIWRCQRGFGLVELAAGAAAFLALYAAYEVYTKKVPALQGDFLQLKPCRLKVAAAIEGLKCAYGQFEDGQPCEDKKAKFLGFPSDLKLPANDPVNVTFEECKAEMAKFSEKVKQGNHTAIAALSAQIDEHRKLFGQCALTSTFR